MIVKAILKNGIKQADTPVGVEYKSTTYLKASDEYLVEFTKEQLEANRISPAQGRTQLNREGKLDLVENYIADSGNTELKIFWGHATFWDKTTDQVKSLATAFSIDLEVFWASAKAINI